MATRIVVHDFEKDITAEFYVSIDDAKRAQKDNSFARELLEKFIEQDKSSGASTSSKTNENEDLSDEVGISNISNNEDVSEISLNVEDSEGKLLRWCTPAVSLLLETYRTMENVINKGKLSNKQLWNKIAGEMMKHGFNVTGPQCDSKMKSLKKTYKSIKDHNAKSGNSRRTWQFYDKMDAIFGKKAWCDPVATASSSGLLNKRSECNNSSVIDNCRVPSNSKNNIMQSLETRIKQKEEHEENRKRRHKERMEMDEKFLNILEKLVKK